MPARWLNEKPTVIFLRVTVGWDDSPVRLLVRGNGPKLYLVFFLLTLE